MKKCYYQGSTFKLCRGSWVSLLNFEGGPGSRVPGSRFYTMQLFYQLFCGLEITRITPLTSESLMILFIDSKKGLYLINMYVF